MKRKKLSPQLFILIIILVSIVGCGPAESNLEKTPSLFPSSTSTLTIEPTLTSEPALTFNKINLIYDDDGSRDGTVALLYLLNNPEISIEAISISYGEAHPSIYIQHIGRILDSFGFGDIPLGAGQDAPLSQGTAFPDWLRQLSDTFWDYPLPNAEKIYPYQDAPELMISTIKKSSDPVIIFLSGTFTNLAQALRLDASISENITAVYFMGGAVYSPGNITNLIPEANNLVAEWNIISDPLAAKEVFESGIDLYMVPLDATNQIKLTQSEILPLHNDNEKANMVADLYDIMFDSYDFQTVEIFDLTAAILTVKPELCSFQNLHLDVITEMGNTSGQTIVIPSGEPNIHVCLEPDINLINQEMYDTFSDSKNPPAIPSIDSIVGTWTGPAFNNGFEMQVSITIEKDCQLNQICGRFTIPSAACSGALTWVGMDGELYQFQASDKSVGCGEGIDYLAPQADGSVLYVSRGDYGETKGFLQKE